MRKIFVVVIILISLAVNPVYGIVNPESLDSLMEKKQERIEQKQEIRNQNKIKIAEKVNNQLKQINQKSTEAIDRHLTRIQALLEKVAEWKDKFKAKGKDVALAEDAINTCQTAIDDAKKANDEQKTKIYAIEYTDENNLKIGANTAKTNLKADLKTVREKVQLARQKLVEAIKKLKTL